MICQDGNAEGEFICVGHEGYEQGGKMLGEWEKAAQLSWDAGSWQACSSCRSLWAGEVWFLFLSWDMFIESSPLCSCRVSAAAGCPNHPGVPDRRGGLHAPGIPSGVDGQVGEQPDPEAGFAEFLCPYPCCEQPAAGLLPQTSCDLLSLSSQHCSVGKGGAFPGACSVRFPGFSPVLDLSPSFSQVSL